MRDTALANPFAYGHLWCAADFLADGAPDVALVGEAGARAPFVALLARTYAPTLSVAAFEPGAASPVLSEIADGKTAAGGELAAYLCRNFTCTLPARSIEALETELRASGLLARSDGLETPSDAD
jgi:uncharacterized protein YyaL (SSP411 family)